MSTSPAEIRLQPFPGGLALTPSKTVSLSRALTRAPLPTRLYVPIGQHQGEAGEILVEAGQQVEAGQALTSAEDDFQVAAHAPCAGTVIGLVDRLAAFPPGSHRRHIEIQPGADQPGSKPRPLADWSERLPAEIVDHLRAMGLAGMGGALFPTAAKLRGPWPQIHTLILNGAECEPWISCDESLMREDPQAILRGGLILAAATGARRILLALEDHADGPYPGLEAAAREHDPDGRIEILRVPAVYPQGGERQLIQTLTGLEVPHDGLPQDLGLLCHNVATAAAAFEAVERGLPLTERVVTVTGPGIARPCNLRVAIGTPIRHLVALAGGYTEQARRLILGGPMSGTALPGDEIVITKGSNCVLVLTESELGPARPALPCINCGACVPVCPASLLPQLMYRAIAAERTQQARELNLFDCIECGCCAQVCPSHIPLVDYYRHGKAELRTRDLDQRRAALARRRHEARQVRLTQEQAERQARRQARAERLQKSELARDDIQAAIERARTKKQS